MRSRRLRTSAGIMTVGGPRNPAHHEYVLSEATSATEHARLARSATASPTAATSAPRTDGTSTLPHQSGSSLMNSTRSTPVTSRAWSTARRYHPAGRALSSPTKSPRLTCTRTTESTGRVSSPNHPRNVSFAGVAKRSCCQYPHHHAGSGSSSTKPVAVLSVRTVDGPTILRAAIASGLNRPPAAGHDRPAATDRPAIHCRIGSGPSISTPPRPERSQATSRPVRSRSHRAKATWKS